MLRKILCHLPMGCLCLLTVLSGHDVLAQNTSILSSNQKMKTFLLASAYGTLIGATIGGATLAFSSNPSNDAPNIAKGASLGLYAGMIYGFITVNSSSSPSPAGETLNNTFYLTPQVSQGQVAGTELHYIAMPF
jgi:hypothetical protein